MTPYNFPTTLVQNIILEAVSDSWGVEKVPAPSVVSNNFNERGFEHWIRVFTKEFGKRDKVTGGIRDRIWHALHRRGIPIPGPLRHVDLKDISRKDLTEEEELRMRDYQRSLKNINFLDELFGEEFATLAANVQRRYYAGGEVIVRQGDKGSELFFIRQGKVAASIRHEDGTILELNRMGPDKFFSEVSPMAEKPRMATVRATENSEIYVVDKEVLAPILAALPNLADHMSDVLAAREAEIDIRVTAQPSTVEDAFAKHKRDVLEQI